MKIVTRLVSVLAALTMFSASADDATKIDIAYERFVLDNGLTVLVHSDHSTPTVFVGMWYGVGSKDEPEGKTGFAHLFEHLMFQGTENREGEFFSPFTDAGATGMNGTTNEDRTNYFATVPSGALDMALWMESDRMANLLGAVTQEALDEQRGVVQNEKRQGEARPYAQMYDKIRAGIYPVDHPYRHSIIGSMEDLDNATLEDVHEWFDTYYGGSNVVLVLAGDVTLEDAKEKVAHYFSEAPAGVPLSHPKEWIPNLVGNRRELMYDNVGQTRVTRVWPIPGRSSRDTSLFYLLNESLVSNKNSPLRKKLVDDLQLVTEVWGGAYGRVMSGEYSLTFNLRDGVEPEQVLAVAEEVIADYIETGPDAQIVENAKLGVKMFVLGGLETGSAIGRMLVEGELFHDDPLFVNTELDWLNAATTEDLREIAERWLTRGYYELTVVPFPEYGDGERLADRSEIPDVTASSEINFPEIEETTLRNGAKLVVANRGSIPLVDVSIQVDTGGMAAPPGAPGVPNFVFALMDKGTKKYDANELAAVRDRIAMAGQFGAGEESSSYGYRILTEYLAESLEIATEIMRNPTFPQDEVDKYKARVGAWLANLAHAPNQVAGSLFERAIYGDESIKGALWSPAVFETIDRDSLLAWHANEITPDNMTIYMIGDITIEQAEAALNKSFGKWRAKGNSALQDIGGALPAESRVILVDMPGTPSSTIYAGHAIAPFDAETWTTHSIMNRAIGGGFESRLNMNLREDKGWSYGYRSGISRNRSGDMTFATSGQVQTDKTAAAMQEILRELQAFVGEEPATASEVDRIKMNRSRSLPGSYATNRGFLNSIISSDGYGLPYDYAEGAGERIAEVTLEKVRLSAKESIDPSILTWVIVGDLSEIEEDVRALNYGQVEVWDAFGNVVR